MHKIIWNFKIKTDHLARIPIRVIINIKGTWQILDFTNIASHNVKIYKKSDK